MLVSVVSWIGEYETSRNDAAGYFGRLRTEVEEDNIIVTEVDESGGELGPLLERRVNGAGRRFKFCTTNVRLPSQQLPEAMENSSEDIFEEVRTVVYDLQYLSLMRFLADINPRTRMQVRTGIVSASCSSLEHFLNCL